MKPEIASMLVCLMECDASMARVQCESRMCVRVGRCLCVCALIVPWCRPVEECGVAARQPVPQVCSSEGGGASRRWAPPPAVSHVTTDKGAKVSEQHLCLLFCLLPSRECVKRRVTHWELFIRPGSRCVVSTPPPATPASTLPPLPGVGVRLL